MTRQMASSAQRLRAMLREGPMVVAPGAFNGMTAQIVEQNGFSAVYMTGAGTSLSLGYPDLGLVTLTEMVANAGMMARSVGIPLIADADTGFGNELNVTRTIREYERNGVAGLHMEDQVMPKRCGHMEGKQVVERKDFLANIRAAVAARSNPDFLIIARTDARAVLGFDEAIARANDAIALGADMAFVEAPQTLEEIAAIPKQVKGPCLINIAPGGRSPSVTVKQADEMGYRLAIMPGLLLKAVIEACDAALQSVKDGSYPPETFTGLTVRAMFSRFGADDWDALRQA
jgi:2-methylisocitrate lyase-like PEP mutase family enzyme